MAAADNNVRPTRQRSAVTARRARPSRLARLLLSLLELLQLDRKLLLLFVASLMPACIIPVGPEWQDPPGQRNGRPEYVSIMPPTGSIATNTTFRVVVSDPDGDDLFVRWMADVPPFTDAFVSQAMPLPRAPAGTPVPAEFTFECLQLKSGRPTHQIMAVISDSDFSSETDPFETENGPAQIQLVWTLEKSCQAQQ